VSQKRRNLTILGSVLAIGCLTIIITLSSSAIDRQLHSWKLLPEPERLTELYFTDHAALPTSYSPGATQTVSFTVHNLEYRTTSYHFVISQRSQTGKQTLGLASGNFTLKQNQYSNQKITVSLGDLDRSQVIVSLTPGNENINYWVTRI
jgi:hypothetical protein